MYIYFNFNFWSFCAFVIVISFLYLCLAFYFYSRFSHLSNTLVQINLILFISKFHVIDFNKKNLMSSFSNSAYI